MVEPIQPKGVVGLAEAIEALRAELARAAWSSRHQYLRFKPGPVELTLEAAITSAGKGSAGIRWWLVELGGEVSHESVTTQTLKLTLDPLLFNSQGGPTELLVSDSDDPDQAGATEQGLDDVE